VRARLAVLAAAAATLAATVSPAGAVVQRDALIRPGVGIAKLRLGMSPAQVRAAMGRPLAVLPQQSTFGRQAVEWQYGYGAYTVRLEGRRNALRVVAVATTAHSERTREGFGVGTLESRLERAYAGRIRCERLRIGTRSPGTRVETVLDDNRDCALTHANGTRTVFVTWVRPVDGDKVSPTLEDWERDAQVLAVEIRAA
jgi:hypothetical protein